MKKALVLFLGVLMTGAASATEYSWNGVSGDFQTDSNWTPAGVPGGADPVAFTQTGPYAVSFSDDATNTSATVGADVTFDLAGRTWRTGAFAFSEAGTVRFRNGMLEVGEAVSTFGAGRNLILESGVTRFRKSLGADPMSNGGTIEVLGGDHQSVGLVLWAPPENKPSFWMTNGLYEAVRNANGNSLTLFTTARALFEGGAFSHSGAVNFYGNSVIDVRTNAFFSGAGSFNYRPGTGQMPTLLIRGGTVSNTGSFYMGLSSDEAATSRVALVDGVFAVNSLQMGKASKTVSVIEQTGGVLRTPGTVYVGNSAAAEAEIRVSGGRFETPGIMQLGYTGGSTGRLVVAGGEVVISNEVNFGSNAGAMGDLTVSGGSLIVAGNAVLRIGRHASGVGRVVITGGTFYHEVPSHGMIVGYSSVSTSELVIAGGNLIEQSVNSLYVGWDPGSNGRVTINGGTNDFRGGIFRIGGSGSSATGGSGVMRITGGETYVTNTTIYVGYGTTAAGLLELAGGVLTTKKITRSVAPSSKILFDGGTLRYVGGGTESAFVANILDAALTDNGAVIDSNGGTLTIPQALSNATGCAGSFTKKGAGKVTLSSPDNAFTGQVGVEAGELAVTGATHLSGGVAVDAGAALTLTSATLLSAETASGTASRIDGTLTLAPGGVLTNGAGAALGGSGTVNGSVRYRAGSAFSRDKSDPSGTLSVSGDAVFEDGAVLALTGYTVEDLQAGIPVLTVSGAVSKTDPLAVTLDGLGHPYWRAVLSGDGTTLAARVVPAGTLIRFF
ncbi:MAG: hypothetical protein RBT78_12595 [Kiritimatiellia bacterium]|jgi:autotransporter-associated beta strand protein|nr:hypothetical protein [Kiritimatiellia bacterium]